MAQNDYTNEIKVCTKEINRLFNSKDWADDEKVIKVLRLYHGMIYQQIHNYLVPMRTETAENQIRELIKTCIIGYTDKKRKIVHKGVLKPIKAKMEQIGAEKRTKTEFISRYLELYDDFYALAAFRSFKHFALYIEKKLTEHDEVKDGSGSGGDNKIIEHTLPLFEGWYYYATRMVLDGDVKFIAKQMPTSYGKSYGDVLLIPFILGYDIENDVIKVFGNPYNCERCFSSIVELMCRQEYAKVFPYFQQFNGVEKEIFEKCSAKDGALKIKGSHRPVSFLCVGKDSKISGVRGKYIFLDDITQAEDANILSRHAQDIYKYNAVWKKRTYGKNNSYFIAGGTAYSIYDLLSHLKKKFGFEKAQKSKAHKYTSVATSNEIVQNGISAFVIVPKLDYETDESTYPAEFDTFSARKEREENYETFMAMEQQMPVPPKNTPFYHTNLLCYDRLPNVGENGRAEFCMATLDGKRKGSDFCAMPIFCPIGEKHYLIDAVYDPRPMEDCYDSIVSKIIQHNVTMLCVESNINEGLPLILRRKLQEQGYNHCTISETFNYEKKEDRIAGSEASIRANLVFPAFGMYSPSHPIGMALQELYFYSYEKKPDHDDFTDAISAYCRRYLMKKKVEKSKAKIIHI